ncbi:hypothetical protein U1Q18_006201 [Sarracenia purpurea var. burkii]
MRPHNPSIPKLRRLDSGTLRLSRGGPLLSIALGYNTTMKMKEYHSALKAIERQLHHFTREPNSTCDQVGLLKRNVARLITNAKQSEEAFSL